METEESEVATIRVTLLTSADCGFCDDAKAMLARLASEYPLAVEVVDLRSPLGEELAARGGMLFPPGVFLDGAAFSYGRLSERKLRRAIERRAGRMSAGAGVAAE